MLQVLAKNIDPDALPTLGLAPLVVIIKDGIPPGRRSGEHFVSKELFGRQFSPLTTGFQPMKDTLYDLGQRYSCLKATLANC